MDRSAVPALLPSTLRRNFSAYLLSSGFTLFGTSLISSGVIMTLFVSNLTSSKFLLGLVMTVSFAGWTLPQVFTAPLFARARQLKRPLLTAVFFAERLPLLLFGPVIWLLTPVSPVGMLVVFFVLQAWNSFGTGSTQVGTQELFARLIPVDRRGRLAGITGAVGIALGLGGAALNRFALGQGGFPNGYALLFSLAGLFALLGWACLWLLREQPAAVQPTAAVRKPEESYRAFFGRIPALLKNDPNYTRFLIAMAVLYLGGMSGNFLAVAAKERFSLPESLIVTFPIGMYIGQALGSLLCGWIADRRGYKILQIIANAANVALLLIAIFTSVPWLYYIVFALKGLSIAADTLGGMITFEFSSPALRPAYIGIYSTASGIIFLFSPLLAGILAEKLDYTGLFWITALITAAGIVLLQVMVRDPRRKLPLATALEEP